MALEQHAIFGSMLSPIIVTCLGEVFIEPTAEAECVSDQFNRGQHGQRREYTAAMICLAQRPRMTDQGRCRKSDSGFEQRQPDIQVEH